MLILTSSDTVTLLTTSTSAVDVHVSYVDFNGTDTTTPGRGVYAVTTATTTTIVAAPDSGYTRNVKLITVRNKGAATQTVTVGMVNSATTYELVSWSISPQETMIYADGFGWTKQSNIGAQRSVATADQTITAATDTILTGGTLSATGVQVGTVYKWSVVASKTAASTAAATFIIRTGTAGTTADTARVTFTLGAQTAAADTAQFDILSTVRGPISASCVMHGALTVVHHTGAATGFVNVVSPVYEVTSSAFDITPAGTLVSLSVNSGASAAWTVKSVVAERYNP